MYTKIYILLIFAVYNCYCQFDLCNYNTCGECIRNANCVWCSVTRVNTSEPRCVTQSEAEKTKNWCKGVVENPKWTSVVTANAPFSDTVQLIPQRIKIKARPNTVIPITVSVKPAKNYPIDVYFLMDVSYTMKSQKNALQNQAHTIYKQLKDYTNNVRLGVGSFVEKPGYPYVDKVGRKHEAHSFKNHLSLTDKIDDFTSKVKGIKFGANFDDPEAGLDALMQVMTCEEKLGWRPGARRIIVLCTDSTYHSAGDGKPLGVIRPNTMQCLVDDSMLYNETMALTYDYPSVSQINTVAKKNNFIIIFAAKSNVAQDYQKLAVHILGATYANLENDDDVVKIIKKVYQQSANATQLTHDFPLHVGLSLDQDCISKTKRNCESSTKQRTVIINANITIHQCPEGRTKDELPIKVIGLDDKLIIDIEYICQCNCEKETKTVVSPECSNAGFVQCGLCKCDPGRYGVNCRCTGTSNDYNDSKNCRRKDEKRLCSGRGTCRCGKCETCDKGFSGNFCEFNDANCPNNCKGHGICTFGSCHCDPGYTGHDCGCPISKDACVAPYSKQICSGNGECVCGKCKCNFAEGKNSTYYSGNFCEDCDGCAEKRCKEFEKYAVCNFMNSKSFCDTSFKVTDTILVEFLNNTQLNDRDWNMAKWCKAPLENGSSILFKYKYPKDDSELLRLAIQSQAELPAKANIIVAVGSAIGVVLLIGILTLIVWKILVDIHDKKEFEKFSKESKAQGYDVSQNPLYSPPQVNFSNPAYQH